MILRCLDFHISVSATNNTAIIYYSKNVFQKWGLLHPRLLKAGHRAAVIVL